MWSFSGAQSIMGRGWWLQRLNVEPAKRSRIQAFILATFSSVRATGSVFGLAGGGPRGLHPPGHVVDSSRLLSSVPAALIRGKSGGIIPSAIMTDFDRNRSLTPSATRTWAAVSTILPLVGSIPARRRTTTPRTLRLVPLIEVDALLIRHRSDFCSPILYIC